MRLLRFIQQAIQENISTVFAPFSAPGAKKIGKRGRLLGTTMLQERRFLKSSTRGSFIIRICVKVYGVHTV